MTSKASKASTIFLHGIELVSCSSNTADDYSTYHTLELYCGRCRTVIFLYEDQLAQLRTALDVVMTEDMVDGQEV